jgi:hypothetical protein
VIFSLVFYDVLISVQKCCDLHSLMLSFVFCDVLIRLSRDLNVPHHSGLSHFQAAIALLPDVPGHHDGNHQGDERDPREPDSSQRSSRTNR